MEKERRFYITEKQVKSVMEVLSEMQAKYSFNAIKMLSAELIQVSDEQDNKDVVPE